MTLSNPSASGEKTLPPCLRGGPGRGYQIAVTRPLAWRIELSTHLEPILPHIHLYRDAVNVYVLQWENGETALFDLGSGGVLAAVDQAGMPPPSVVLHTDYRRDRTFGHYDHPGLRVALGSKDVPYMATALDRWKKLKVDHGYAGYAQFWMPRESIAVDQAVSEGELVVWNKPYVYAQAIGAHTPGGMGYLIVDRDQRYLISGDLLQADGTLHSIFELQRTYNFMEGLHAVRRAVGWLASGDIHAVLPSHGDPIIGRDRVVRAARMLLARIADFWERWRLVWPDQPPGRVCDFKPITPHLRGATNLIQYAVVDDEGNAVFFDTGTGYPDGYEKVLAEQGIRNVEIAFITHHHDDHVMGMEWLRRQYGTQLAAHECMVDVLEHPNAYALNCLHDKPLKVDIVLWEGAYYDWRGYRIHAHRFPSQTEYHAVYFCEVDDQMVLFSGDALYWEPGMKHIRPTDPDWRNRFDVDGGYLVGAPLLKQYQPRVLAAAHVYPWPITEEACTRFEENANAFHASLRSLVGRKHPTMGMDPFFISIYPYRAQIRANIPFEVRIDNPLGTTAHVVLEPRFPSGIIVHPKKLEADLAPKAHVRLPLTLHRSPAVQMTTRAIWTLRVIFDGEDLGEFCEGMLEP